jgi:hypothetical protein
MLSAVWRSVDCSVTLFAHAGLENCAGGLIFSYNDRERTVYQFGIVFPSDRDLQ